MYRNYSSDYPNQVHQLLVSVSKHFLVGAKNRIRHQKKIMDVSLKNFEKSEREHIVHYILRDHFSGFYYVEVASTRNMISLQDFLLRGFLPKPDINFCGIPEALMIPKQVEDYFPRVDKILDTLGIQKIYPPSGFASGMIAVKNWESIMKIPLIPDEGLDDLTLWNPRTPVHYCEVYNSDNFDAWKNRTSKVPIPDAEYVRQVASPQFKLAHEFPLYKPLWERE